MQFILNNFFKRKQNVYSLQEYQKKNSLSRKALAKKLGITEQYLSFLINGRRTPGAKIARRISDITGIPLENLIK